VSSPLRASAGIDLNGMEAMVLQLGSQASPEKMKPLFDQFRTLLREEMLPSLQQERGAANSLLEEAAKGFESCHGVNGSRIPTLVAEHQTCRSEEFRLKMAQSSSCNRSNIMADIQQKTCKAFEDLDVYPSEVPLVCNKDLQVDSSHEAHAKRVRDFYATKVHALLNAQAICEDSTKQMSVLQRSCQNATLSLKAKSDSCLTIQRSLDDFACEAWTDHYACEKRNSCLSQAQHRYLNANGTGVSTEAELRSQFRAVKRIECLLDAMEMNKGVEECRHKIYDASAMALSYPFFQDRVPQMPNVSSCKKPLFQQPGSPGYVKEVYDLPAKSSTPAVCTAECCSRCEFFTCNASSVLKPGAKTRWGFSQEICCERPPEIQWKADEWPPAVCSKECGLHEVHETRKVLCWDAANLAEVDVALCSALKQPSQTRVRCPATASCGTCKATSCPEGHVAKLQPPSSCAGPCTAAECCDRLCSAEDCPVGHSPKSPAPTCTNCTVATCCDPTRWSFEEWKQRNECDSSCGQPEVIQHRSVLCKAYPVEDAGQMVRNDLCEGPMPATSRVQCPATAACVADVVDWVYSEWKYTVDCSQRECGMRELTEDREVQCKDKSGKFLPDTRCPGVKPSTHRVICPATPACKETTTTSTTSTTSATSTTSTTSTMSIATTPPLTPVPTTPVSTTEPAKVGSWVAPAWSTPDCSKRCCGLGELKEERAVQCMDCNGRLLPDCSCAGPKPATATVLCPATSPCGSPLAPASTTPVPTTTATTAAPSTTVQAGPSPVWVYTAWMTDRTNCHARRCGEGALVQERPVLCKDLASGRKLLESNCTGSKPETTRILCPATAPCQLATSTSTTTTTTLSSLTCCPKGFTLKSPSELPLSCRQGTCEVETCCSMAKWVYDDWDETPECDQSCGLAEQIQERSVSCQAIYGGELLNDALCSGAAPSRQRSLCPATEPCASCAGFVCGDDALPVLPPPPCADGVCESLQCCRKFLSGFHTQPDASVLAVANEGHRGGTLKFQGEAPQLSDGGHFFQLNGETSMDLLTPSVHNGFTALVYLRPHAEAWVDKEQEVLVQKGVDGDLWKLVLTPMKQFRIYSFKNAMMSPSSCTCASVHEAVWSHVMVRDNSSRMDLVINGKSCCGTSSSVRTTSSGSSIWLEEGLQADLHSVEIWDVALNDQDVESVTRRYHKAIPDWLPFRHLSCTDEDPLELLTGISSLAHCKLRCEAHLGSCRSVLFDVSQSRCLLRSRFACTSCGECARSVQSLAANYDDGCRKNGAFDWRLSVTLEKTVRVTELTFLDEDQRQIHADTMTDGGLQVLDPSCALSDWKTSGPGCAIPHGNGFWEYRFKKCMNPTYLVMAVKEGDLPPNFPVKIRYSTAAGEWMECSARPVLWITSDHSDSALRRFHLSCFGVAPLAESPWWHH